MFCALGSLSFNGGLAHMSQKDICGLVENPSEEGFQLECLHKVSADV